MSGGMTCQTARKLGVCPKEKDKPKLSPKLKLYMDYYGIKDSNIAVEELADRWIIEMGLEVKDK